MISSLKPVHTRYTPENAAPFTVQAAGDDWRKPALQLLAQRGLPTPRLERWKYTNLAGFMQSGARVGTKKPLNTNPLELPWMLQTSRKFVFVNGHMALGDARLTLAKHPVGAFADSPANTFDDATFWALNTALFTDGPNITITENNTVFEIIHVGQGSDEPTLASARSLLHVAKSTNATVIEQYFGLGKTPVHTNAAFEIELEAGATLHHIRIQNERPERTFVSGTHVKIGRDASYNATFLNIGASAARQEYWAELNATGGACTIKGAQLMAGRQHMDTTINITHNAPHCASSQTIRNVVAGEATGVFQGKIHVDKAAQKTDGYQLCNTLMLSPRAQMNTKPELEIYADDVKCSHGTTTGQIDETPLFYMRARGIPEAEAKQLLLKAFIGDLFEPLPEYAHTHFEEYLEGWLEDETSGN